MAGIAWPKPHGKAGLRSKPSSLIEILNRIMLVSDRTSCLIEAYAQTTQRRRPRGAGIEQQCDTAAAHGSLDGG